jgi:DNA-binding MarR family transcriptional regulator
LDSEVSEKSFQVLEIIAQKKEASQRELAEAAGVSLGMVNLILKRLVQTGYLKVSGLSRKKMEYILTPKGISERMARSYQYLLRAYHTFHESRNRIEHLINQLLQQGHTQFTIVGEGEIARLVEVMLRERGGQEVVIRRRDVASGPASDEVVLDCRYGSSEGAVGVSVLEKILNGTN